MGTRIDGLRIALGFIIDRVCADKEIHNEYGCYSVDDIINQVIMEYIIKDYQVNAERKSILKHREAHGMTGKYDADRTAQLYKRLVQRATHYKDYNRQQLIESSGITRVDFTRNPMDGPSNWQNAYTLTDIDFHDLMLQDECPLLSKIFEHKISSKTSVPNPMFQQMFSIYESKVNELYSAMDDNDPRTIIEKTIEYFSLQWLYCIELFYDVAIEAERQGRHKDIPFSRVKALCAQIGEMPPTEWFPIEIRAVENRMLMKRQEYIFDLFNLNDEEWAFQRDCIADALKIAGFLGQLKGGAAFIPIVHEISEQEKADFIKENYWIWKNRKHYEWPKRSRIQSVRDLYEHLTMEMPTHTKKNS